MRQFRRSSGGTATGRGRRERATESANGDARMQAAAERDGWQRGRRARCDDGSGRVDASDRQQRQPETHGELANVSRSASCEQSTAAQNASGDGEHGGIGASTVLESGLGWFR